MCVFKLFTYITKWLSQPPLKNTVLHVASKQQTRFNTTSSMVQSPGKVPRCHDLSQVSQIALMLSQNAMNPVGSWARAGAQPAWGWAGAGWAGLKLENGGRGDKGGHEMGQRVELSYSTE